MKTVRNKISIGITGTIGSGKSTVTNCFKEKGYNIFDSDYINNYLLYNDLEIIELLKLNFNECFEQDLLIKSKLSDLVFSNEQKRSLLNSIMHPRITKELDKYLSNNDIRICEVPLLFELNLQNKFDIIILVVTDIEIIKQRLINKGYNTNKINSIINIQKDYDSKIKGSDVLFYNNKSKEILENNVNKWIKENL